MLPNAYLPTQKGTAGSGSILNLSLSRRDIMFVQLGVQGVGANRNIFRAVLSIF